MFYEIIGNYRVYCGDEYLGVVNAITSQSINIVSANDDYDLENMFDYDKILQHMQAKHPMFSVYNQYGLFRFVQQERYHSLYDYIYENNNVA